MGTALITGASGGIGMELARVFARHGHRVVLVARSQDKLRQLASELEGRFGIQAVVMPMDLGLPGAPANLFQQLQQRQIAVDYLVNNAGFGHFGFFGQTEWAKEEQMIRLNILALSDLTRLFLQPMVARGRGRILNVASVAAFLPGPLMAVYFATKAYVLSFSEAIANELQGSGVQVTALCPGPTDSGFVEAAALQDSNMFAPGKLASSQEVAEYGYQALMSGKRVAVHGLLNKLTVFSARLAPRRLVTALVRRIAAKNIT